MPPAEPFLTESCKKALDRASEDLERAAARQGFCVTAIHDLAPGVTGCRVYEVCHSRRAREALEGRPEAAILVPCRILLVEEEGGTRLVALRPGALLGALPGMEELAEELEASVSSALKEAARE